MSAIKMLCGVAALATIAALAAGNARRDMSPGGTALVVHVGNDPADLRRFEAWLGCPVAGVAIHTGQANWQDWSGSIGFQLNRWSDTHRTLYWSVPLIPEGANLSAAAAGRYSDRYAQAARDIVSGVTGTGLIRIRTGWEFNTAHMPWKAHANEKDYILAYRQFVGSFRSVSPRFRFEWTPNIGGNDDPARAYPGDGYVDVIGMDAYYNSRWDPAEAQAAWVHNVERPYGFRWLETFAMAHGKPTAYAEWGVMTPDAAPYLVAASRWFDQHRPVYQSYWNSNSAFHSKLSDGALPLVGAAYRTAFASCGNRDV
ncbi:glycosyl hydrolase [Sphingomonas sp. M6A6_1c]